VITKVLKQRKDSFFLACMWNSFEVLEIFLEAKGFWQVISHLNHSTWQLHIYSLCAVNLLAVSSYGNEIEWKRKGNIILSLNVKWAQGTRICYTFHDFQLWRIPSSGILHCVALVRIARSMLRLLVTVNVVPSSPILSSWRWKRYVPPKRRFFQEPQSITSQETEFFMVIAVKTNLT
jgi:hypothetical protein